MNYVFVKMSGRCAAVLLALLINQGASAEALGSQANADSLANTSWCGELLFASGSIPFALALGGSVDGVLSTAGDPVKATFVDRDQDVHTIQLGRSSSFLLVSRTAGGKELTGWWASTSKPFQARVRLRASLKAPKQTCTRNASAQRSPDLQGDWRLAFSPAQAPVVSGMLSLRLDNGEMVGVVVLESDGDKGPMRAQYTERDGLTLSSFDGQRALLLQAKLRNKTLKGNAWLNGELIGEWTAKRSPQKKIQFLEHIDTDSAHARIPTAVKAHDGGQLDLAGNIHVITVFATWCPNCRSWFVAQEGLMRKYPQLQSLSIVADMSGDPEADAAALKAYMRNSNSLSADRTVLLTGSAEDVAARLAAFGVPEAALGRFPVVLFVDAQRRLRALMTGFPGPAARSLHDATMQEVEGVVKDLLQQAPPLD